MIPPLIVLARALARRANPWNWSLQLLGLILLILSLGFRSATLFGCGAVLVGASLFELHLTPMPENALPRRLMAIEHTWRSAPWNSRKIFQASGFGLLVALLFYSLLARDLGLGLLAIGAVAATWVGMAQGAATPRQTDEEQDEEETLQDETDKPHPADGSPHPLQ